MSDRWGRWQCPYEGCENICDDPDFPRVTCCGVDEHTVLLGGIEDSGWRWAEKYTPTETDLLLALVSVPPQNKAKERK